MTSTKALHCAVLLLLGASALAQSPTTGAIAGHLPNPNAGFTLSSSTQTRQLRTDAQGNIFVVSLPPAEYTLDLHSGGGEPLHLTHIVVEVGSTTHIASEAVTVSAEPEDLDAPPASISTVISSAEIAHLPIDGRRWQSFALLTPQASPGSGEEDTALLSFRGLAPTQNSSRIDGADDDQSFNAAPHGSGTDAGPETEDESESEARSPGSFSSGAGSGRRPGAAYTFSQGAVQEFRVTGQNGSSLSGHAAGGIITTVSRSGTETLHGSLFYLIRASAFAATNPFSIVTHYTAGSVTTALVKPADQRQQFGATIGGPLLPSRLPRKLFYFYAIDAQRRSFPAISSPENPAFYALTTTQRALLEYRGVTAPQIDAALTYIDSLTGTVPRRADQTVNFLKLDADLTPRNHLSLQGNLSRFSSPAGIRSAPVVNRGTRSFGTQNIAVDSVLLRWLYTRGASFSNELRLHGNHDLHSEQAQTPLPQEPAIANGGLAPEIAIGPQGFYFGTPASLGRHAAPDEHRLELNEIATVARGHHLLQAGVDWSHVHDQTDSLTNTAGTFHYDSGLTNLHAGGLVDWITDATFNVNANPNGGCPSIRATIHDFCFLSFSQTFGAQSSDFSTEEFAAFLQDRWRPSDRLALTLGLRYEYELLPIPQQPNPAVDAVFSTRGATSIFPEDRNNLGPRAALAWQPFGEHRGTLRVAYGLYFGRLPGATVRSALTDTGLATSSTRIRILPTTVTNCPQVQNQGFGYPCTFTSAPPSGVVSTTSITVFDRRFRTPAIQQGSLSVERDLGHLATVSASYLVNLSRQLPNSVDINIAPSTGTRLFQLHGGTGAMGVQDGEIFILPLYTARLSPSFGPVTAITSNANATYNALVVEARHRSRNGLEFRASFTWSKTIDFGENTGSVPRTNSQLDPFDIRYDKSLSALNLPHKIVASAIWQPTPALASHTLQHLAAGWLVAPILTETSGRPYTFNIFGGTRLSGGHESINGSGGDVYLPTVGRNTLRLPDTFNVDLRLSRDLPLTEKLHLHAIAEAFNLTNHVNYSSTTERAFLVGAAANGVTPLTFQDATTVAAEGLSARPFAAYTASSAQQSRERQLQFGLNLSF